jgi:hypothetical protein
LVHERASGKGDLLVRVAAVEVLVIDADLLDSVPSAFLSAPERMR